MSETTEKIYCMPDSNSNLASTMALMNSNGCNSWSNNPFMYLIWLAFFGGNGFGWGNRTDTALNADLARLMQTLLSTVTDNHNNDLAMQAILGNGKALSDLAGNLNIGVATLGNAISSIKGAIDLVGANNGTNSQAIVNSVLMGNKDLVLQIASCCCENKQLVTLMGYEGLLRDLANTAAITSRIDQLSNGIQTGFASTAYETLKQTNDLNFNLLNLTQALKDMSNANTDAIIAKLNLMTTDSMQDKITTLTAQLTAANSRAERAAELAPIISLLNAIKAAQPATLTIQYPLLTAVPNYVAYGYNNYNTSSGGFWN